MANELNAEQKYTQDEPVVEDARIVDALKAAFDKPDAAPAAPADPVDPPVDPEADPAAIDPVDTPVEKTDEEKAAETKAAEDKAAADKAAKDEAAGKEDMETLPEGVKEATRRRFEVLKEKHNVDKVALAAAESDASLARGYAQQWHDTIASTKASPEQFGSVISYLKMVNEGTREGAERAYEMMQNELRDLGKMLGKEAPSYDPLDDHPDLKDKVETMTIDREVALEVARARASSRFDQVRNEQSTAAQQTEVARGQGAQSLKDAVATIAASDPHYAARQPYLGAILRPILASGADPKHWLAMFRESYGALPAPAIAAIAAPAVVATPAAPKPPDSIRSGHSGASVTKEPKTMLEAVMQGRDGFRT